MCVCYISRLCRGADIPIKASSGITLFSVVGSLSIVACIHVIPVVCDWCVIGGHAVLCV